MYKLAGLPTPINIKAELAKYNEKHSVVNNSAGSFFSGRINNDALSSFFNPHSIGYGGYGALRTIDRYTNRDISCEVLRKVASKAWLINVCILNVTRKIKPFLKASTNKNTRGFCIHKRSESIEESAKKANKKELQEVIDFVTHCGNIEDGERDDIVKYGVKVLRDVMTIDEVATELVYNKLGKVCSFYAIDAGTVERVAPNQDNPDGITYVQVIDGVPKTFYKAQNIIVDYMNARTDVNRSCYGYSIVEQAVDLIASQINAFAYNAGFFSENRLPKGMITLQGNPDQDTIEQFEDYLSDVMSGNSASQWRIPIMPSGTENGAVQWVSFGANNRDMEFQSWLDFLTSGIVAMFGCSMDELGLQSAKSQNMFERTGNTQIETSKGLVLGDMLGFLQSYLNKILALSYPEYILEFVGYEKEDRKAAVDIAKSEVETYKTLNEIRKEKGLEKLNADWADECPANAQFVQLYNASKEQDKGNGEGGNGEGGSGEDGGNGGDGGEEAEDDSNVDKASWARLMNAKGGKGEEEGKGEEDGEDGEGDEDEGKGGLHKSIVKSKIQKSFNNDQLRGKDGKWIKDKDTKQSNNFRRIALANSAPLIEDIEELDVTKKNYKEVGKAYLASMQEEVNKRHVAYQGKRIGRVDKTHIFKDKNTVDNIMLRVKALPFVLPIIEKYGVAGKVTLKDGGTFYEVIGRGAITFLDGVKRHCAITVILLDSKKERRLVDLSLFVINNRLIKAMATDVARQTPNIRASAHSHKVLTAFEPAVPNSILPPSSNKSIVKSKIQKSFNNSQKRDKSGKWIGEGLSRTQKLKNIAIQSKLITNTEPLVPTRENARRELARLCNLSKSGGLLCHCLNDRKVIINEISAHHQKYKAKNIRRMQKDIDARASLLPFVEPILNKTGLLAEKDIKRSGSYGIVGRAIIDNKEVAIKIVLQESKDGLLYLSVLNVGKLQIKKSVGHNLVVMSPKADGFLEVDFVTPMTTTPLLSLCTNSLSQGKELSIVKSKIQKSFNNDQLRGKDGKWIKGKSNTSALPSLVDNIDKILNGTKEEREGLKQKYFKMADTPQELKEWLKGDKIIVRYGVIARHKGKDIDHNFSADEWKKICKKISTPLAIEPYKDWYNVYINFKKNGKTVLVAIQTKTSGKNTFVNDVKTVFAKDIKNSSKVIFLNKERLEAEISDREQSPNISAKPNISISPTSNKSIVKSIDIW